MPVVVDGRWDGNYGIGRFGREIRQRLTFPRGQVYTSSRKALSPAEIATLYSLLRRQQRGSYFYSPGFTGTFRTRNTQQLLTVWDLIHLQSDDMRSLKQQLYYRSVVRPAVLRAGMVMTGSSYSARQLRTWLGPASPGVDIHVVGCGVSEVFTPSPGADRTARCLLVSGTQGHKNAVTALAAIARVGAEADWVVADAEAAASLLKQTSTEGLVRLHVAVDDVRLRDLYRSARVLLFPSLIEGFGLPPIEAMSCGTPVVYNISCEPVAENAAGVAENIGVSSSTNVAEWAEAITAVEAPPANGLTGFDATRFSWDRVARGVAASLATVLGDHEVSTTDE